MRFPKKVIVGVLAAMFSLGMVNASQAAELTPVKPDPGPLGNFAWEGFNWDKRFWDGGPHYNRDYEASNVTGPDENGYVKLNITNPTGSSPIAAEFQSTRRGFGYGTYSTTVEKNIASLQKEVVWGCLFTYDPDAIPGHTEIDLCEASAWGGGAQWGESWPVEQGHGYWFDATKPPGQGNAVAQFPASNSPVLTHKMVWEPGKITYETYSGEGYTGPLLKRTVLSGPTVPVPSREHVVFNLWVVGGGGGNPNAVKPEQVIVRDFTFMPASSSQPTSSNPSCLDLKLGDAWAGVGTHCGRTSASSKESLSALSTPAQPTATNSLNTNMTVAEDVRVSPVPSPTATVLPVEQETAMTTNPLESTGSQSSVDSPWIGPFCYVEEEQQQERLN